jgi:hypothetical protein
VKSSAIYTPNAYKVIPANNLRRISTMYVRGYLQGSENGRVVTIGNEHIITAQSSVKYLGINIDKFLSGEIIINNII